VPHPAIRAALRPAITQDQNHLSLSPRLAASAASESRLWLGARDPEAGHYQRKEH